SARWARREPVSEYRHNVGEDNADGHLKRQLMAHQVVLAITDGRLDLGPWEQVFYAEVDGRRRTRSPLKAMGDGAASVRRGREARRHESVGAPDRVAASPGPSSPR